MSDRKKITNLNEIKKENTFSLPDNYFENFEDKLNHKIENSSINNREFNVPENYFENIELELQKKLNTNNEFNTPVNYFTTLENDILSKTVESSKVIGINTKIKTYLSYAASIAAVLLLSISINNYFDNQKLEFETLIEDNSLSFSSQELYTLINDESITFESEIIDDYIEEDDLENYLYESDIENSELLNLE